MEIKIYVLILLALATMSPVQGVTSLGPYEPGHRYYVSIYNIDDTGTVYVNDNLISSIGYGQESGLVDITDFLKVGYNTIRFVDTNDHGGAYAYGFRLYQDSSIIWADSCGKVGNILTRVYCNTGMTGLTVYDNIISLNIKMPYVPRSPGFEFILVIMGIFIVIYLNKEKKTLKKLRR